MRLIFFALISISLNASFGQSKQIDSLQKEKYDQKLVLEADSTTEESIDRKSIRASIDTLFSGLKIGDSALMRTVLHADARLQTTFTARNGNPVLKNESIDNFLKSVGTPRKEQWNEVISDVTIEVDDLLAQVWMNYSFYLNDEFSHCGVNAMQLFYDGETWKIIQLIDTRRRKDCQ